MIHIAHKISVKCGVGPTSTYDGVDRSGKESTRELKSPKDENIDHPVGAGNHEMGEASAAKAQEGPIVTCEVVVNGGQELCSRHIFEVFDSHVEGRHV
jgi:hypothetical protein